MLEPTGKLVDVEGFHQSMEPVRNIPVATTATAVDLENKTVILECPQSLFFGNTMENSLIPPAQLWDHGLAVDVVPCQYSDGRSLFGIHVPDDDTYIPFKLYGCISYIPTR
jgi:hypothetical protein